MSLRPAAIFPTGWLESCGQRGIRALGFFHLVTGLWLMYLTFATTLNISLHYLLPGG